LVIYFNCMMMHGLTNPKFTFPVLFIYDLDEFWPSKGETLAGECSWNV